MQYNKYSLALVMLASSAFASASDFDSVADEIVTKHSDKSPFELYSNYKLITEDQVIVLKDVDLKDKSAIIKALTDASNLVLKAQLDARVEAIFNLSEEKVSDEEKEILDKGATEAQYELIKSVEDGTGTKITKELLRDILSNDPSAQSKIDAAIANRKESKISAKEVDKKKAAIEAIMKLIDSSSNKIAELSKDIIADYKLQPFQVTALTSAESVNEAFIEKVLEAKSAEDLATQAPPTEKAATFEVIKDLLDGDKLSPTTNLDSFKLTPKQKEALKAKDLTEDKIKEILKSDDSTAEESTPGTEINSTNTTGASDTSFYKQKWFIITASVFGVIGIGGGAYLISHQKREIDL